MSLADDIAAGKITRETTILERVPAGTSTGRLRVIKGALAETVSVRDKMAEINSNKDLTPIGRAKAAQPFLNISAVPELLKMRKQAARSQEMIDNDRAALHKKAIGESKATDPLWLQRLWGLTPNKRIEEVLRNPAARAAALREPELAGIDARTLHQEGLGEHAKTFELALQKQIIENFEREAAKIQIAEKSQEILNQAIGGLTDAIIAMPAVVTNGEVRSFHGRQDFENSITKDAELSKLASKEISLVEKTEVEFD
jgi:hypothetical protein